MSSWNQTKIIFGCYLRGKSQLHEGGCLAVGRVLLRGCRVVVLEVAAGMVGGANPGEKMDMGLEEEGGRELYRRAGAFVWLLWVERDFFWGVELLFRFFEGVF